MKNQELITKRDLAELKLELIKWVLGTGLTSVLAVAGIVFTLLKVVVF